MKCAVCEHGETKQTQVTEFLERNGNGVVIRAIPAMICENCGEVYFAASTTKKLLEIAETAISNGERIAEETFSVA